MPRRILLERRAYILEGAHTSIGAHNEHFLHHRRRGRSSRSCGLPWPTRLNGQFDTTTKKPSNELGFFFLSECSAYSTKRTSFTSSRDCGSNTLRLRTTIRRRGRSESIPWGVSYLWHARSSDAAQRRAVLDLAKGGYDCVTRNELFCSGIADRSLRAHRTRAKRGAQLALANTIWRTSILPARKPASQ